MDPLIGAAIVQSAADVDLKYQKGIASIWKTVQALCKISVKPDDDEEEEDGHDVGEGSSKTVTKLGSNVLEGAEAFFRVSVLPIFIKFIFITSSTHRSWLQSLLMLVIHMIKSISLMSL